MQMKVWSGGVASLLENATYPGKSAVAIASLGSHPESVQRQRECREDLLTSQTEQDCWMLEMIGTDMQLKSMLGPTRGLCAPFSMLAEVCCPMQHSTCE